MLKLENMPMSDIVSALANGRITATALTSGYLARIEAYDRAGPKLNSVRELNPDALAIAAKSTPPNRVETLPLQGIPILLKDNIATGDNEHTTAGSLALEDAQAKRDATVGEVARDAGAVILGKANLTEFANILAVGMPSGYSSLGGQVLNPYAVAVDDKGVPIVQPGGSSSGSAVAVAAGLCGRRDRHRDLGLAVVAGEPERHRNGEADRRADQPRRHHSHRRQPGHRRADDAHGARRRDPPECAAGPDPLDPATQRARRPPDYTSRLASMA